ncbi:MAG: ankyrin repeat domain-containing protein [Planctomycetota bacterium]
MTVRRLLLNAMLTAILFSLGCDNKDDEKPSGAEGYPEDAIHLTVIGNDPDGIKYFVSIGFDINKKNEDGYTPLSHAIRIYGTKDSVVDCLLELGANPNIPDDDGALPLEQAVSLRMNEKAISLLEHGALLQRSKGKKGTLIHEAIRGCNADVIKKMLECGGEKLLYTEGDTIPNFPVEMAIDISGDIDINGEEVASMLLDHMDLNYTDEHGNNLLHRECIRGDLELIQMLLEKGMDVNAENNQGLTPLRLARNYNNGPKEENIVTLLLSCGAEESKEKEEDCEPPFTEQDFIAELKQKTNLNERDEKQRTSLHYAVSLEFKDAVDYLLSKKVDVNVQDYQGITPLTLSITNGDIEMTKMFLDAGARLDTVDKLGNTPLDWAIGPKKGIKDNYEFMKLLIEKGAPIDGVDNSNIPIFGAIGARDNQALKILVQNGADVNIYDWTEQTPLMQAIHSDNIKGLEILLKNGADINKKNKYEMSALDVLNRRPDSVKEQFLQVIYDSKTNSK